MSHMLSIEFPLVYAYSVFPSVWTFAFNSYDLESFDGPNLSWCGRVTFNCAGEYGAMWLPVGNSVAWCACCQCNWNHWETESMSQFQLFWLVFQFVNQLRRCIGINPNLLHTLKEHHGLCRCSVVAFELRLVLKELFQLRREVVRTSRGIRLGVLSCPMFFASTISVAVRRDFRRPYPSCVLF